MKLRTVFSPVHQGHQQLVCSVQFWWPTKVLDLVGVFDFIATRDDVEHGKPNPEIYKLVSSELAVPPNECLVIEDFPAGVQAALAAGMLCVAVTTPFTRERIHASELLDERWIVDDPQTLPTVVEKVMAESKVG